MGFYHVPSPGSCFSLIILFDLQKAGSSYELKNADGNTLRTWTPMNDFSMLVFSDAELQAGMYTLYKDGEQLSVQSSNGMKGGRGGMMGGERQELPKGERPQMPEGEEIPEMPADGEMPPVPDAKLAEEDIAVPEGNPMMNQDGEWTDLDEIPKGEMPQGKGGFSNDFGNGETVTEFEIKDGGNMFRVVTTKSE